MALKTEVVDRLLLAKFLLGPIVSTPVAKPDRLTIARHILTAHDAAELAIAGIAYYLECLPDSTRTFFMDYFTPIKNAKNGDPVPGRDYFSALNRARTGIKHHGDFPDVQTWYRVGENTYQYISEWCTKYLKISFEDLDESALIKHEEAKELFIEAQNERKKNSFKGSLENLARALFVIFSDNPALRDLSVGKPKAEDAIKLSAFGVHANDFLVIQEFLPLAFNYYPSSNDDPALVTKWEQEKYGHPTNWTAYATDFCLRTFVHVAVRIQDAEWIPGAIDFFSVYEHKLTALVDNVEIVNDVRTIDLGRQKPRVVYTLNKGESIRGTVEQKGEPLILAMTGQKQMLNFSSLPQKIFGEVEPEKVKVTCVPRRSQFMKDNFPDLPELEYGL